MAWLALLLAIAYGITDEVHQHFVPGRHMDPLDLLTDAVGAAAAVWLARLMLGSARTTSVADKGDPSDSP